jgi:hypothetical protein
VEEGSMVGSEVSTDLRKSNKINCKTTQNETTQEPFVVPIQYKSNRTNKRTDQRYPITWCHFCQMLTKY